MKTVKVYIVPNNVTSNYIFPAQGSQQNMHVLVKLLTDLRTIVRGDSWWGTPLGSSQLWGKHVRTIDRIGAIASSIRHAEVMLAHTNFIMMVLIIPFQLSLVIYNDG
jgi:phage gp46-like protein